MPPSAYGIRWLGPAIAILCSGPAVADPSASAREPRSATFRVEVDASRFSGDYGSTEEITFDALATNLRWRRHRLELRLGLPYLRLEGSAALVGGTPIPGERAPTPVVPGPPGSGGPSQPAHLVADTEPASSSESGPGDVDLRLDFDLVTGAAKRPWLTALGRVKLPTADETKGFGTGETDVEGGLLFFQPLGRFGLMLEGRYTKMGDPPEIDYENVVQTTAGLSRKIGSSGGFLMYALLENRTHPVPELEARRDVMLGASKRLGARGQVRVSGAVYAGLSETAEDWGSQLTLGRVF